MLRIFLFAVLSAAAFAQDSADLFNKPPDDVDKALRARINEFYGLHVKGEFRKAEALVADDTQEFYYNSNKTKYLSFEIGRITYSDNFTRARATVLCEQYIMLPGFLGRPFKVPSGSTWKIENGKWYWYVDPESLRMTPFGKMTPGPPRQDGSQRTSIPEIPTTVPDFIYKQVSVDKDSLTLKPGETGQVTITNSAPGAMSLSVSGAGTGVETKLEDSTVGAGKNTTLSVRAKEGARSCVVTIRVEQTTQTIPVQVTIQ
jgi:hypothetical protein